MISVGYASLKVVRDAPVEDIVEVISNLDLDGQAIKPYDLHMTLIYDKTNPLPIERTKYINKPDKVYQATAVDIRKLGDAVVMILESDEVMERFDELSLFMKHSFDDMIPHVSLVYDATDRDFLLVEAAIGDIIRNDNPVILLYGESFATVKKDA